MSPQSTIPIQLRTPLAPDALLPWRASVDEALGRPFACELDLLSLDPQVPMDDVLGKPMTLLVDLPWGGQRKLNGIVTRFAQTGRVGRYVSYRATLRPGLWLLTLASDCRIFGVSEADSGMTVPDIVRHVVHGAVGIAARLHGSYLPRTYCVQYRESDFAFVSRLLEEEGIYYFFEHADDQHTLVLANGPGSHAANTLHPELPFMPGGATGQGVPAPCILEWAVSHEVQSGAFETRDFDFASPHLDLTSRASRALPHAMSKFEVYDPPGSYVESYGPGRNGDEDAADRGRAWAAVRLEERHAGFEVVDGTTNTAGLTTGSLFKLTDHDRADQNREYLVTSTHQEFHGPGYESGAGATDGPHQACRFRAIPSRTTFRSQRTTPRPVIAGPQTATVVGKAGEEIWTDKHGRVKVQFHWDRLGKKDENSSCWVRVAQVWAGANWGGVHIPRIGQEVVVEFLEGDPDRPLITGRVYNGKSTPPYGLPANATQSGLKSRSSKDGGAANFNEIRFEDKKGSEEVYLHAERNKTVVVENDHARTVGHDESVDVKNNRSKTVGVDQSEKVGSNKTISVGVNHTENIGSNMGLTVGADRTASVGANDTLTVGSDRSTTITAKETHHVGISQSITVGAKRSVTVGASDSTTVGAKRSVTVGVDSSETVGGSKSLKAGSDVTLAAGANLKASAGASGAMSAAENLALSAKKIAITAQDEVIITVGSARIVMKDGKVSVNGTDLNLTGSGKISVKADSDICMKGSKITHN
jgi:type VI secretion system secreted protein VgrG